MHERFVLIGTSRNHSTGIAAVLMTLLLGVAPPVRADVGACISAHSSGQREAKAGRLKHAAELFSDCAAMADCPDPIRVECVELHRETEKNLPSVIFAVADEHGKDLTDVNVYSNEDLVAKGLDGRALQLDPGKYTFRFELPQQESLSLDVLVLEGEKNRVISARVERSPTPVAPQPTAPRLHPTVERPHALPTGFWISAGVGAAALASFGTFALLGHGFQTKLDECSPTCGQSQRGNFDSMRRDYLVADVSLGVALASAGVATWFLLSEHGRARATSERTGQLAPTVGLLPLVTARSAGLVFRATSF